VRLEILHGTPGSLPASSDLAVWRTCVREIGFLEAGHDVDVPAGVDHLEDAAAYALLLEVVCGLQSPLAGETQVMGQFKQFVSALGPEGERVRRVAQRELTDATENRTVHLQGLGARAYGSLVRQQVRGAAVVALIGTGALAREIEPAVADVAQVHTWDRAAQANAAARPRIGEPAMLIVAAPVDASVVARVAAVYGRLFGLIDLRGEPNDGLPALDVPIVRLPDLFRASHQASERAAVRIAAARRDIRARSHALAHRDELHPFGWDDLCA
jgi:glutamyl-tRNA reductase